MAKETAVKCPNCGLLNPQSAKLCDCGYDFATGQVKTRNRSKKLLSEAAPFTEHEHYDSNVVLTNRTALDLMHHEVPILIIRVLGWLVLLPTIVLAIAEWFGDSSQGIAFSNIERGGRFLLGLAFLFLGLTWWASLLVVASIADNVLRMRNK